MVSIEASGLFGGLSAEEKERLLSVAQLKLYPAQYEIFRQGDKGDALYVVAEGHVRITTELADGQTSLLSRIGPGMFFGEMAVVDAEPRSATAITDEATSVYCIPSEAFHQMLESSPQLALRMIREFSHRMREGNRHYIEAVLQAERLAMVGRFARSIVHDFKNPLNVIGLAAELTSIEKISLSVRIHAASRIRKQVDRLTNMINELLEFTRGNTSGKVVGSTNLAHFVARVVDDIGSEVAEKGITLVCVNPAPDRFVLLDPQRMTHVFYNLITNAVEVMTEGGGVRLHFREEGGFIVIDVEDTGPGIAPEVVNRLFEPFATFGKVQGTGLGLSICKKIVDDHGGDISCRNKDDGSGAVFTFTLPITENS